MNKIQKISLLLFGVLVFLGVLLFFKVNNKMLPKDIPPKLQSTIDLNAKPTGANEIYLAVAKKAVALCGPNIALEQYLPKVFEYPEETKQIPNLERYIFTPGTCYNNEANRDPRLADGFEFIAIDYNMVTKEIGEPHPQRFLYVHAINPIDVSKWRISSDEALKIALKNGGQALFDQGLKLRNFTLYQTGWKIEFILYDKRPIHGGFWADYYVNMETGELRKDEHDGRSDTRVPIFN